jgi:hypothetical protein
MLKTINTEAVIERIFRFLEMILIAALVSVALSAVSPFGALAAELILSGLAGLYIGIPAARWVVRRKRGRVWRVTGFEIGFFALLFATQAALATHGLQALLKATFQIDAEAARAAYWDALGPPVCRPGTCPPPRRH